MDLSWTQTQTQICVQRIRKKYLMAGGTTPHWERYMYLLDVFDEDVLLYSPNSYWTLPDEEYELPKDKYIYRVEFINGMARVTHFEVATGCPDLPANYDNIDDLPMWIQKRVAVLSGMSYETPTKYLENVGRRIAENIYWVFYNEEQDDAPLQKESGTGEEDK